MSLYRSTHLYTRIHVSIPMYMYMSVYWNICWYTSVLLWPHMKQECLAGYWAHHCCSLQSGTPVVALPSHHGATKTAKLRDFWLLTQLTILFNAITSSQGAGQCPGIKSTLHARHNYATKLQLLYLWQRPICSGLWYSSLYPGLPPEPSCFPCY